MDNELKLKLNQIVIIVLMIALLILAGIITLAYKYFESSRGVAKVLNTNPISQDLSDLDIAPVDLDKLNQEYIFQRNAIVGEFLDSFDIVSGAELSGLARQSQSSLLNLTLSSQYRETHLTMVLLLSEIASLADSGNNIALRQKIEILRSLKTD